jgi:translation initiation factor 2D
MYCLCCRYKGVLRKGEIFPTTIPKANLREAFLKRCSQQTRLSRGRQQVGVQNIDTVVQGSR